VFVVLSSAALIHAGGMNQTDVKVQMVISSDEHAQE
jgi:hypothetical protein